MADIINGFLEKVYIMISKEDSNTIINQKPITRNTYEDGKRFRNSNIEPVLHGFMKDMKPQTDICDIFKQGWYGRKVGDKITFYIHGSNIALQYRKTIQGCAPIAYAVIDGDKEHKIRLDGNFDEDWGDCLYLEEILYNDIEKEHCVEIIIEEVPDDVSMDFYLVSIITSNISFDSL